MWAALEKLIKDLLGEVGSIGIVLGRVAIIGAITFFLARYAGRTVERMLAKRSFGRNGALLLGRLTSVIAAIVGITWILSSLGANTTGLVAFFSASTVAISLSMQDVMRNFVAGIFLLVERPFRVGDRVRVRDVVGEIQGIDIRTTLIRNTEGALVMVPNATIFTEILVNRSHFRTRRLDLTITAEKAKIVNLENRVREALDGMHGLRQPIPAPTIRSSTPVESVMELSLLIESSPTVEQGIINHLIQTLGDVKLEVNKPS